MPSQKKWVVDEKGYHAVTEFAPADRTAVYIDDTFDTQTGNTQSSDESEVQLLEGKWLPGEDGFQFNKKCKVQVKARFLKETGRRKITLSTFVEYEGEEEDLGLQVEIDLNDDGIAEGEVMLYYGDKYSDALREKPEAKCHYLFKATHNTAKNELESEQLEMPQGPANEYYGGYELQEGDKDSEKKWGGEIHKEEGEYVKELQEDLLELGYWVSTPDSNEGKGRIVDGDFGGGTKKAVKTFQLEHFVFTSEGSIDESKSNKITVVVDSETAEKIKEAVTNCGSSTWYRLGHNAIKTWDRRERLPTGAWGAWEQKSGSYGNFFQAPPSNGYCRHSVDYGSNELITNNRGNYEERSSSFEVLENNSCTFVMADCWGTEQMINFIKSVGDEWASKKVQNRQVPIFRVADISGFNGGPLSPHAGHQDGTAVDLNDIVCSCRDFSEEWHRECALELAKLLHEKGAVRILFNCHYVIKNVSIAQQCISHHHHFHVDGPGSDKSPSAEKHTTCHDCGIFASCSKKITQVRLNADSPWQDYNRNAAKGSQNGLYTTGGARTEGCVLLSNAKDS